MVHIVYCDNAGRRGTRELDNIVTGSKTMVLRGAAGRKIPHSRVFEGEMLYFMEKGSGIINACATVSHVENYVKLSDDEISELLNSHQEQLQFNEKQQSRWHKKCLCMVEFHNVHQIAPLTFEHQGNMDDWLIVEKVEDVVVGFSVPYNYENSKFK